MNYQKIYDDLIESARLRPDVPFLNGYTETHHILPKSMGGSNEPHNLVKLTAREHFVAHWLLSKIHNNSQMHHAFYMMTIKDKNQKRYFNSKGYEIAKKKMSESQKGKPSPNKGIKHSEESKRKMSINRKGKPAHNKGIVYSKEIRKKMSKSKRNFSIEDIETIKKMKEEKFTQQYIADYFNTTQSYISRILSGKRCIIY